MNSIIPVAAGLPDAFARLAGASSTSFKSELSDGVAASFAILSIRGGKFHVKYKGEERTLLDDKGAPQSSTNVILLRANPRLSKIYYEKPYVEGNDDPPDCFSLDGEKPDPGAPKKQNELCANCPHNAFGSRITDQGKRAKACSDSRRVAIVPAQEIANEAYGGPMLLRIPPASLAPLAAYADKLEAVGYPYFAVVTTLMFDAASSYPKLAFAPAAKIEDPAMAQQIVELRSSPDVSAILADSADLTSVASSGETVTTQEPQPEPEKPAEPAPAPEPEKPAEPADPFAALGAAPAQAPQAEKPAEPAKAPEPAAAPTPAGDDLENLIAGAIAGTSG